MNTVKPNLNSSQKQNGPEKPKQYSTNSVGSAIKMRFVSPVKENTLDNTTQVITEALGLLQSFALKNSTYINNAVYVITISVEMQSTTE